MKTLIKIALYLSSIALGIKLQDKFIDSFSPQAIQAYFKEKPSWLIETKTPSNLKTILKQPFYYLTSGSQSFVFISQDHQYILKFFKNSRWHVPPYAKWLSSCFHPIAEYNRRKEEGALATYKSCLISFHDLHQHTALLHLHTTSHQERIEMALFDALGNRYLIDVDQTPFALQKKITLSYERINLYFATLAPQDAQIASLADIERLIDFLIRLKKEGCTHKDPHLLFNFGFDNQTIVCIDIGGFTKDPLKGADHFYESDLKKIRKKLLPWMKTHHPLLVDSTKSLLDDLLKQRNTENDPFLAS